MTSSKDKGRALGLSKTFDTVSDNMLPGKLKKPGLGKWIVRGCKNWVNHWVLRCVINGMKSIWKPGTSAVSQTPVLWPVLVNILDGTVPSAHLQGI